jgi:transcriptional regulator
MYVPPHFAENRLDVLHGMMRRHSFACIVAMLDGQFIASHVPTILLAPAGSTAGSPAGTPGGTSGGPEGHPGAGVGAGPGVIQLHLAKQNPACRALDSGQEVLILFQGPHAYISPRWYQARQTVPTWNYIAVHAYGRPRALDRPALRDHLDHLVQQYESGAAKPWRLGDIPEDFIQKLMGAIQGYDIPLTRIEGKWKLSQNRSEEDRRGAVAGLLATDDPVAHALAQLMRGGKETA